MFHHILTSAVIKVLGNKRPTADRQDSDLGFKEETDQLGSRMDRLQESIRLCTTLLDTPQYGNAQDRPKDHHTSAKINEQLEREKKLRKEIGQLKVENQWLINNQKNGTGSSNKLEVKEEEFESLANQLKEEKEKVRNLTTWKAQLTEKNKELKEDNHR